MLAHRIVGDPKAKLDRLRGVGDAEHYGVSDRLDVLSRDPRESRVHGTGEGSDQLQRGLVTVSLRQGGEACDVCKQERCCRVSHEMYLPAEARAVGPVANAYSLPSRAREGSPGRSRDS